MRTRSGLPLYEAEISKSSMGRELPEGSRFSNAEDADHFLLGVSYGGEWHPDTRRLRLFAETHDRWEALAGTCKTTRYKLLESLCEPRPEADHVITMTQIPHYFAMFGVDVKL
jgi:hypothetical protein